MHKKLIKELLLNRKKNIKNCNILCMGDIILDHYIYGRVDRISPEAPIPILLFEKENPRDLAKKIDELMTSADKRVAYGLANLDLIKNWPSWQDIAKLTEKIYK